MSTHEILDHYLTARSQRLRTMDIPGKVLIDSEVRLVVFSVIVPHSLATHPRSGAASFSQALADSNPVVAAPAAVGVSVATPGEEQDLADTATRRPAMGCSNEGRRQRFRVGRIFNELDTNFSRSAGFSLFIRESIKQCSCRGGVLTSLYFFVPKQLPSNYQAYAPGNLWRKGFVMFLWCFSFGLSRRKGCRSPSCEDRRKVGGDTARQPGEVSWNRATTSSSQDVESQLSE